jgi:hypothetical protein
VTALKVEFTAMAEKDVEKLKDSTIEEIRMVDTTSTGLSNRLSNNEDASNAGTNQPRLVVIVQGPARISTEPNRISEHCPKRGTVVSNIAGFLPFLALAGVAARFPSYAMLIGCGVVCSALFIGLALLTIFDVARRGKITAKIGQLSLSNRINRISHIQKKPRKHNSNHLTYHATNDFIIRPCLVSENENKGASNLARYDGISTHSYFLNPIEHSE